MSVRKFLGPLVAVLVAAAGVQSADSKDEGWVSLFNGKDTSGWKIRQDKVTVVRYVDASGKEVAGAKKGKVDTTDVVVDAKGKPIAGARVAKVDGKDTPVDADGKPIKDARITKTGGRDAIIGPDGKELKDVKPVTETKANELGWEVKDGELICSKPHGGNDILTEKTFTDFELHIEFQGTSNSGVYLQGRYEIQIDNSINVKPKVVEKDGKKVEELPNNMCGALYSRIAPRKNMAKPPMEWQTFDVTFRAPRGEGNKVTEKARVTLVWNGEKVIDNAEIDGPTGGALDNKVTEPGPLLLQGDHGRVAFRNIRIKPLPAK